MKNSQLKWRYYREMAMALLSYTALLAASARFGRPPPDSLLRTAVLFSPMLGFLGMIWAIARQVACIDEYQRKFLLETWAITGALTAAITFSYGFLETAGYPQLSMFSVWMIMGTCMAAVCLSRWILKR